MMIANEDNIIVTKKSHSSSIKHCGLLQTHEDLCVRAGSGTEFGNDTESVGNDTKSIGKSAGSWLSTIGGKAYPYPGIHSDLMLPPVENQHPPIAQT